MSSSLMLDPGMDRVDEIEAAIIDLAPDQYRRLAEWFHAREQQRWDEQMDRDSLAGNPDFLFDEAESESTRGLLREWPPRQ
jgi:hypothetical protein